jgi:hypothetical protein
MVLAVQLGSERMGQRVPDAGGGGGSGGGEIEGGGGSGGSSGPPRSKIAELLQDSQTRERMWAAMKAKQAGAYTRPLLSST